MTLTRAVVILLAAASLVGCSTRSVQMAEDSGSRNLEIRNYAAAEQDFAYAVDRSPGRFESRIGLAKALIAQDRGAEARGHAEIALTLRPTSDEAAETLAESMLRAGEFDAMTRFLRTRAEDRQSPNDYMRLGRFLARANDADGAEAALITAARIDKGVSVEPQLALADFYESIDDNEAALRRLRMALFLKPQDSVIQGRIRALGAIPGPTLAIQPAEAQ